MSCIFIASHCSHINFYTASALLAMQSAVIATAIPSVRPSVCLSDFKFGMLLGFAKVYYKITSRGKSGHGLGLGELPKI